MGTWGTSIKSNDTFADIYGEFFELYNKGELPENISEKIKSNNRETLEIEEERHNFWFALALAQWETKSLEAKVLSTVENIITSGEDLNLWLNLGASEKDLTKRKIVLEKFLEKLKSKRSKAVPRKRKKLKTPIFSTGDCLSFKLANGNYGGAVVLATDSNPERAHILIATTRIQKATEPSIEDFEGAEALVRSYGAWQDSPDVVWYNPTLYSANYSDIYECVGNITVDKVYDPNNYQGEGYLFKPSWTAGWSMKLVADIQFESEILKPKPSKSLTIRQLTRKNKWWNIFKKG
jgi:hypothetical protein